ncbi:MAG: membrane dipeptidase [Bacteroidaceae bacterium]|nr:membrane dipeptidase [Bacteroidaceae bacterium]
MSSNFNWKADLDYLHSSYPSVGERPLIGISGNFMDGNATLGEAYYQSVLKAGGTPVIIPPYDNDESLARTLDTLDGILLSGGADMNPLFVGEEPLSALGGINNRRDHQELMLVRLAFNRQIPMLGICRGIQMMAAALDGHIYQDIYTQAEGKPIKHSQDAERHVATHSVDIEPGSLLSRIMNGDTKLAVNSFHHQAVSDAGPHLKVSARSADGIIEAVESSEMKSILGVQWHPECFCNEQPNPMMPIFRWLVDEATSFAAAKRLHSRIVTLDSHCDTPMFFDQHIEFDHRDPRILVDLHMMTEGHLDASIMVAYLKQEGRTPDELRAATEKADRILTEIEQMVAANAAHVAIARTPADVMRLKDEGRKAIMMGIENGYAIGTDISNVEHFARRGIVYMTLCHNGDNDICDSARGNGEHGGVSSFGAEVIKEMNRLGVTVDLSHGAEKSFYDALEISSRPIVCSHSSSRALCDHPRNLTDDQMRALARKGGVAQVTFYNGFLRTDGQATIIDAMAHLNHMIDIMGIEHVGIGTDFDGDGGVPGLASASELINFTRRLMAQRYSADDIKLIWGGNFLRVIGENQK